MERFKTVLVAGAGTTLVGAINNSVTSLTVADATALRDAYSSGDTYAFRIDDEIFKASAEPGSGVLTVARAQDGTTAASHSNGAAVIPVLTRGGLDRLKLDANQQSNSANRGMAVIGGNFTLTAAAQTYQATGLSVTLGKAGWYRLSYLCSPYCQSAGGGVFIHSKLRKTSGTAADIANSHSDGQGYSSTATPVAFCGEWCSLFYQSTADNEVIEMYAYRDFTTTPTTSIVTGNSRLLFERLSD